jgi:sigma-B regulation protein RsbU (phosphoserine phosphatase)
MAAAASGSAASGRNGHRLRGWWFDSRIGPRLVRVVTLCFAAILLTTLGFSYLGARTLLERELERTANSLAQDAVEQMESLLMSMARSGETLAGAIESMPTADLHPEAVRNLLRNTLVDNPELFAVAVTLPLAGGATGPCHTVQVQRGGSVLFAAGGAGGCPSREGLPAAPTTATWTAPYTGAAAAAPRSAVLSVPFVARDPRGGARPGVLDVAIELDRLGREIAGIRVLHNGYAVLIARDGALLADPTMKISEHLNLFKLHDVNSAKASLEAARHIVAGETGTTGSLLLKGVLSRVHYAPVAPTGWVLAVVFQESELFADVQRLTLMAGGIGVAGLLLSFLVVIPLARSIARPLQGLAAATGRIAQGEFATPLPAAPRADEIGDLTAAFATMVGALRDHIERLTEATAARERIDSELRIAHDIQLAILPRQWSSAGGDPLALFALIEPAREVGGDFYDYFRIDDQHLCLVIADVSDKGVPAALFMAVTKTLIKATARRGRTPDELLTLVNAELSADNERNMFVTAFCGILGLATGTLVYTNAGHNPPVLIRYAEPVPVLLQGHQQLMLGIMPGVVYRRDELRLAAGDRLVLYTDGVTEAMNVQDELYMEGRLLAELDRTRTRPLAAVTADLLASIQAFAGECPQSDDITLLAIEWRGQGGRS